VHDAEALPGGEVLDPAGRGRSAAAAAASRRLAGGGGGGSLASDSLARQMPVQREEWSKKEMINRK